MIPHLSICAATDPGKVRRLNQDAYAVNGLVSQTGDWSGTSNEADFAAGPPGVICLVADGMGGYPGGELAATAALAHLSTSLAQEVARLAPQSLAGERGFQQARSVLSTAYRNALSLLAHDLRRSGVPDAGTTLAGLWIFRPGAALVFHCGDARVLRWSNGYLRALTVDHSPFGPALAAGEMTEAELGNNPALSQVTRAVGLRGNTTLEIGDPLEMKPGDVFLLCSDGFFGLRRGFPLPQLRLALNEGFGEPGQELETATAVQRAFALVARVPELVRQSLALDGSDNVTLLGVAVGGEVMGPGAGRMTASPTAGEANSQT